MRSARGGPLRYPPDDEAVYRPSERQYTGEVSVGVALAGECVGVEPIDDGCWHLWLGRCSWAASTRARPAGE